MPSDNVTPVVGTTRIFSDFSKINSEHAVVSLTHTGCGSGTYEIKVKELFGISHKAQQLVLDRLGSKLVTFIPPQLKVDYKDCSICKNQIDPEEMEGYDVCPLCGGELIENSALEDPLDHLRYLRNKSRQIFLDYTSVVFLDENEDSTTIRQQDRPRIYVVHRKQLTEPIKIRLGVNEVTISSLDHILQRYKQRFYFAKNRILEHYDEIHLNTLEYYARFILSDVTPIDPVEQEETLNELATQLSSCFIDYKTGSEDAELELPAQLQDFEILPKSMIAYEDPTILAGHPTREMLENALKKTIHRYLGMIYDIIPTRAILEQKIQIYWNVSSINIPFAITPEYDEEIVAKENEVRRLELDWAIAEGRTSREALWAQASKELAYMKRMKTEAIEEAHRKKMGVIKSQYDAVIKFLEKEFGELLQSMMEKDEITIRNIPKLQRIERIVTNLSYFNSVIGSKKLNQICTEILTLVTDAREKGLEDQEFNSRVNELQEFLTETQQYLQVSNSRLERIIDTPNPVELKAIFDESAVLERDIALEESDEIDISIEGTTINDERL